MGGGEGEGGGTSKEEGVRGEVKGRGKVYECRLEGVCATVFGRLGDGVGAVL